MRLVFIHGMRQEGKDPEQLRASWETALSGAWSALGLPPPRYELEMPFYGDELEKLTNAVRGGAANVVARGGGGVAFTPLEEEMIRGMAEKAQVADQEVRRELGAEVVARGPANWEWVQALARLLEKKAPPLSGVVLRYVSQVDAYLTRDHIRAAVDAIVKPALNKGPTVVVAHSLGTIVSYALLRNMNNAPNVPLYVTLGSPLGIQTVQSYLKPPPLGRPGNVNFWLNGVDERDYVALVSRLDQEGFAGEVLNYTEIHNRQEDAHFIEDYLADKVIAQRIHAALV